MDTAPVDIDDTLLRDILRDARVIAVVGWSPDPARPSHFVADYLAGQGYRILCINPGHAGQVVHGHPVLASLADVPDDLPVDMIDIFRRPQDVPAVVAEALAHLPHLRTVWMQIGVSNPDAAAMARAAGKTVVMERCPLREHPRLFGR